MSASLVTTSATQTTPAAKSSRNQSVGNVMLVGATSSIARSLASEFARRHYALQLAGRNMEELERIRADLIIRFQASVSVARFEASDHESHQAMLDRMRKEFGQPDIVVVMVGELLDQKEAERNFDTAHRIIQSNYVGVVSLLTHAANRMEAAGRGTIVAVSSVAGDRGRQSNYIYGSAKAGLSVFLQGLGNRLSSSGVHVLTVKPGFVDTKMNFGKPGRFLVAPPEHVASSIIKAIAKKDCVLYTPWFWRWLMLGIKLIPERAFKRMRL